MNRIETMRNLLAMAFADSTMTEREIQLLMDRSAEIGLDESEFAKAIQYALTHRGELQIPTSKPERIKLLGDLLKVMAADGVLADAEKKLFASAAVAMQISDAEVNAMIDGLTSEK